MTESITAERLRLDQAPISRIALDQIAPATGNRHTTDDDAQTIELTDSMREIGQLQPIIVRRFADGAAVFQILAGERRWRAARLAGFETIEVKVVDADDRLAQEITIVENLQRTNPHPLEEARGIRLLLDGGWDGESIARHLGKSLTWVTTRAQLTNLSQDWTDLGNKTLAWATVGHWELIAKLPAEVQHDLAQQDFYEQPSIAELDRVIRKRYLNLLKSAPWKLDDAELVSQAGACTDCTHRSACQQNLFGPVVGNQDRCLDAGCWARKTTAHIKRIVEKLAAKHAVVAVLVKKSYGDQTIPAPMGLPDQAKVIDDGHSLMRVTKTTPGAIAAVEAETGHAVWIKPAAYCDAAVKKTLGFKDAKTRSSKAVSDTTAVDSAQANANRREAKRIKLRLAAITETIEHHQRPDLVTLLRLAMVFVIDVEDLCSAKAWDSATIAIPEAVVLDDLWGHVREALGRIYCRKVMSTCLPDAKGLAAFETFLGFKPADQIAMALAEIPEPKARAKGKAKRTGAA